MKKRRFEGFGEPVEAEGYHGYVEDEQNDVENKEYTSQGIDACETIRDYKG